MMPGEAPAAGIAAEAATACANCSALQQNLNEYVAALIALKQKIIDTDRLLTEYQQKCNELQLAERENNTLRHQVEQMLQKISPLEECQQELGSLKAELEEKKSSLKIYQQTHLEYARVKEEIVRSDAVKKKLEAKVKKLEEAATKHMQDFRQLKTEKKVLEKELKKAQEKLDDFPKQKYKKVLKHAETQSAREDPVANIDKGKIKLLLEELWMCIDSSTGKRQNQENDYILAASVKDRTRTSEKTGKLFTEEVEQSHRKFRKSNGKMPYPHSSPETIGKQNSLTTLQIKVDKEPHRGDHFESKTTEEYLQDYNGDNAFYEDKTIKVVVQTDLTDSSSDSSDQEQEQLGGNLLDILNWVRPLPPLLSPVRFSPPAMQDTLFGESTDSSDEEIDHNAHIVESILEGKAESQSNCNFVSVKESNEHEKPHEPNDREIATKLRENEETSIYIDTFSAKSSYVKEKDAEGKQTEMTVSSMNILAREEHLEEDSENIGPEERERTVKVATPKLEAINEKEVHTDQIHSVEEVLSSTCMSSSFQYLQEKSSELVPTEKTIATNLNTTANSEHMKEKSSKLMEAEEAEIPRKVETPKPASTLRDGVHLQTGEPIFATESILVTPEDFEEVHRESMGKEAMENESSDIQTKSNVVNTTLCIEKHVEKVETAQGQVIATVITEGFCVETNNEPRHNEEGDVRSSFSNSKSCFGAEHDNELVCQCNSERTLMQTEIDTEAKDISTKSQCSELKFSNEETLDKQCERTKQHGVNEEGGLESNNTFRHDSFVLATERSRDSLYIDGENHIAKVCKIAHSMSAKGGDGEQLRTGEQCVEVNLTQPEQKVFTGSSTNKEDFLETCRFAKSLHVMEVGKLLDAKEERCLQAELDHEQKDASKLLQKKPDFETTLTSPNPAFDINGENDPLEPEEIVKTNHVLLAPEHVTEKASEMRQAKNTFIASEHRSPRFQNCIEVFEPQGTEMEMDHSEVRERRSGPLETEKINTVKSVITESEHASWAQFLKHVNSCSITEISQCDKIREKLNDKPCEAVAINNCNNSPDLEENGVEEVEMRNQISDVTGQVVSEENAIEEPALSIEDVLETGSIDTEEINTPVTVAIGLERIAVPTDLTAFNLQHLAKPLLRAILSKLKTQKMSLNHNFTQALCRVYVGICRQLGDLERARLFCYSLLKEDFPQSAKLTLFITNVWDDIFSFQGVINKAMQLIARQRARGEVLHCLSAYLSWEKSPPLDAGIMVSSLLLAIQLYPKMEFQLSERYGEDLSESTWECILAIDLLCSHLKWGWTHDNIISKELWPVMDKWVKHRKGHETIPSTPDIIVASTLRLIGRLCQIGLKEGFFSAVKNISFVIGRFIQHAKEEDVPWGVQLAAVYALCDLGPSNPVGVIEAIRAWRTAITNSIPAAVTSGIAEVSSLCTAELHSDEGK
ncbi:little elongation complex subunit 1 isoform X7 [Emydura macquarii macquarii]|uniref:little elongation complex subunit 1 isoform X7 n=1 Tax=Emydura macquarii macquarii TaxID=1129001 RepID=UPI00352B594B